VEKVGAAVAAAAAVAVSSGALIFISGSCVCVGGISGLLLLQASSAIASYSSLKC
jgi:hypothetical protein